MKHEKHHTCWIERRWHVSKKSPFPRLATGLLVSNSWIQLKIVLYWRWYWRQWCRDVASGADRHLDITFGLQVVERSLLVSVPFREVFSHPYISFLYLLVNVFFLLYVTERRKREHLGQKLKTELLVPSYTSCLGLSNDTFCEARSATNTKIQDAKVTPRRN